MDRTISLEFERSDRIRDEQFIEIDLTICMNFKNFGYVVLGCLRLFYPM